MRVNLDAVFVLARGIGAYMLTRPQTGSPPYRGSIINVASLVSFQGGLNVPAYAAAKGGVAQLTKSLSNQWASRGINVNAVRPTIHPFQHSSLTSIFRLRQDIFTQI
jgi:2-deoxy-D-gluconate 3-dehydrogenase